MNTKNPGYGLWVDYWEDEILPTKYGACYCPQVSLYETIDPDEELHAFNFKRLSLISNDIQAKRIWKKIVRIAAHDDAMILEYSIGFIKPILEEENILPKDMSDIEAIRWLVKNCYEIKVKGKVAK